MKLYIYIYEILTKCLLNDCLQKQLRKRKRADQVDRGQIMEVKVHLKMNCHTWIKIHWLMNFYSCIK